MKEVARGIGQVNSPVLNSSEYAVTVTVSEGSSLKNFTQIVAINNGPAKLQIKYSLETPLNSKSEIYEIRQHSNDLNENEYKSE